MFPKIYSGNLKYPKMKILFTIKVEMVLIMKMTRIIFGRVVVNMLLKYFVQIYCVS